MPNELVADSSKDKVFLAMAKAAGQASKCPRQQFGAILVDSNGRVRGHGYNGTIKGTPNLCGGDFCLREGRECEEFEHGFNCGDAIQPVESGTRPDIGCIHAETNLFFNSNIEDLEGGTLYINGQPCLQCAKFIAQCQLRRVVYKEGGYTTDEGLDLLRRCGIKVDGLVLGTQVEFDFLKNPRHKFPVDDSRSVGPPVVLEEEDE